MDSFECILERVACGELTSGVLSAPRNKAAAVKKVSLRPLMVKQQLVYQRTDHYQTKVIHENFDPNKCAEWLRKAFELYSQGILHFADTDCHVLINKKQHMTILRKPSKKQKPSGLVHNRAKKHVLAEGEPVPFLVELGVMTAEGKVIAKKYDKFRQINRFLEMVRDIASHLSQDHVLQVVDFGCGKAYLTFALYHYLHRIEGRKVIIKGLDLKKEVIEYCQGVAERLSYSDLHFAVGDINDHRPTGKIDLMVALHACDTATDAALEKAVVWDTDVILCVPCCQHELYRQVKQPACDTLLRHGILKERFAALATDAARADLLAMRGYEVQLLEFIDMEHTPKNLLIRAVKEHSEQNRQAAKKRYMQFKEFLHINPALERLLKDRV